MFIPEFFSEVKFIDLRVFNAKQIPERNVFSVSSSLTVVKFLR